MPSNKEADVVRSTQMDRALRDLGGVSGYLEQVVNRLEERLAHVRNSVPKQPGGADGKSLSTAVPLVQHIDRSVLSVGSSIGRLEALMGELEI